MARVPGVRYSHLVDLQLRSGRSAYGTSLEDTIDSTNLWEWLPQVLAGQIAFPPPKKSALPVRLIGGSTVLSSRILIVRQGINSFLARVGGFLRKNDGSTVRPWHATRIAVVPIAIIGLVTKTEERRLLAGLSSRNGWHLLFAETYEEARAWSAKLKVPVILCDRDFPSRGWREVIGGLASSPHSPCIILLSSVFDNYLWNEVVRTGGYDVLPKPLREDAVVRAVRLALTYWNSAIRTAKLPGK